MTLLCRTRYAFVHAHEESVFFCRFLKPLFGFKLVYDMHSSLPEQLRNFKFTESRVLIRAFILMGFHLFMFTFDYAVARAVVVAATPHPRAEGEEWLEVRDG